MRFKGILHAGEHYALVEYGQSVLNSEELSKQAAAGSQEAKKKLKKLEKKLK